jgi:hypothetical protein
MQGNIAGTKDLIIAEYMVEEIVNTKPMASNVIHLGFSWKQALSFGFPDQNSTCISYLLLAC